ncbi:MAG: leucine-rich repeat protein [Clostridia bacterium]|nr:leucine-rich repeat protein [Clostridia bacterium]
MKRKFLLLSLSVLLVLSLLLTACGDDSEESGNPDETEGIVTHTVTFDSQGGSYIPPITVLDGTTVHEPPAPTRGNSIFMGWYNGTLKWSFTKTLREDVTLVAKWAESEDILDARTTEKDQAIITGLTYGVDITKITSLVIPDTWRGFTVVGIGESAFEEGFAGSVTKITVPPTVTSIGAYAFADCANVTIDLSTAALTEVGAYAFANCNLLRGVFLGEGLTVLSDHAFMNCTALSFADLPSTLTLIDESVFEGCVNLSAVLIPRSVERIGHGAFRDCDALKTVFFEGDRATFDRLLDETEGYNEPLVALADEVLFYSETEPTESGKYWYYDETHTPKMWETKN